MDVTDEDLLGRLDEDPDAFGIFYRRHVGPLLAYFRRRTGDPELAADLCAETFAAALDGAHRFRPDRGPAVAWLYGIARHQLSAVARRGRVDDRARRRLGMPPIVLDDEAIERVEAIASAEATGVAGALAALPPDQRAAVSARVLDDLEYEDIAVAARTSESVVRKRVSRGLAAMRARLDTGSAAPLANFEEEQR
jgi:RNA polymerase sigma-70 factor (ECF subfamily)